jgi:hypothetical protein
VREAPENLNVSAGKDRWGDGLVTERTEVNDRYLADWKG